MSPSSEPTYRCNFCGNQAYDYVHPDHDYVRCTACGLVSVLHLPTPEQVQVLYEKEYTTGESFNQFYTNLALVRKTEAALRLRTLARLTTGRTLLDVGAGMGYFVEAALEKGWDVEGIEISQTALQWTAEKNLPIVHGSFDNFETAKRYDVITLWAMIEHALDPKRVLEKAHELLKPGGLVVVETGDISSRNATRDGIHWRMFYIAGHLYFFPSETLDRALKTIGFSPVRTDLDKWIEHTLMQNAAEYSVLQANNLLPPFAVKAASYLKHYINRAAARLGLGDVMIKVARKEGRSG